MIPDIVFYISVALLCTYICVQCLNIGSLLYFDNSQPPRVPDEDELPAISILVAARNEEQNIVGCLKALDAMDYPRSRLQILVGNDQSEDRTFELVEEFIKDRPHFSVLQITEPLGKARGKANVLAQLAHKATGELFLITDADITVNPHWAKEIVAYFDNDKMGIVSGVTIVEDYGTMGRMQEIDWMYFMGLLISFANLGLNCTAVGNNMAISKRAYWNVGGYENLDFSVTEDYKLYKEVRNKGWNTRNVLNDRMINRSAATKSFRNLMHQRKRWLIGARELPFYWWILFSIFGSFAPAILVVFIFNIKLALIFYFVKLALQCFTVNILQDKMKVNKTLDYLLTYEIYSIFIALSTQFFYFVPGRLQWKNRTYKA